MLCFCHLLIMFDFYQVTQPSGFSFLICQVGLITNLNSLGWTERLALTTTVCVAYLVAQEVKHLPARRETRVQCLGREDPLEKEMATHSSTLAWKIPWTEEPARLQSMGSQRVRHDWATSLSLLNGLRESSENICIQWKYMHKPDYPSGFHEAVTN